MLPRRLPRQRQPHRSSTESQAGPRSQSWCLWLSYVSAPAAACKAVACPCTDTQVCTSPIRCKHSCNHVPAGRLQLASGSLLAGGGEHGYEVALHVLATCLGTNYAGR